jgi:glucose/arabinose dehydrogenase
MTPTARRLRAAACALTAVALLAAAGCADFSSEASTFTVQPSLTAPGADPRNPTTDLVPPTASPSVTSGATPPASPSGSELPADPCTPTDLAVIATCLEAPWGLAPLPDGISALVGERTTGRILRVQRDVEPELVAQIDGIDATGDGGLLGIALSPSYDEDGLVYAYVTTAEDNRIIRIARGDVPKPIFTGIPKGTQHNGGRIAFAADRTLYVGTGDTGTPTAADPASLAGKVLRLDEFGQPAPDNPTPGSPIYARGFTQISGLCPLDDGRVAALDHRDGQDLLFRDRRGPVDVARHGRRSGRLRRRGRHSRHHVAGQAGAERNRVRSRRNVHGHAAADPRRPIRTAAHRDAQRAGAAVAHDIQQGRQGQPRTERRSGRGGAGRHRGRRGRPRLTNPFI